MKYETNELNSQVRDMGRIRGESLSQSVCKLFSLSCLSVSNCLRVVNCLSLVSICLSQVSVCLSPVSVCLSLVSVCLSQVSLFAYYCLCLYPFFLSRGRETMTSQLRRQNCVSNFSNVSFSP